jgi:hypothetical protein
LSTIGGTTRCKRKRGRGEAIGEQVKVDFAQGKREGRVLSQESRSVQWSGVVVRVTSFARECFLALAHRPKGLKSAVVG